MQSAAEFLLALGGILLLGLATDLLGKRTFLPRITLLLIFGIIIGNEGLNLIPELFSERFEIIANMTLLLVGFLLGGMLTRETLQQSGKQILSISVASAVITTTIVSLGLIALGISLEVALLLGCIASATAPAATYDTVTENGGKQPFSRLLLAIVALDDAWGLILFSLCLTLVSILNSQGEQNSFLLAAVHDIGGAILLGLLIGLPAAYLTGRVKPGQPMLTEALGVVFLCGGLAIWLNVSFLIAAMVLGATIANLAKHHDYPFNAIEGVEWPLMIIFFVLAGASLDIATLNSIGLIGLAFIVLRIIGKVVGANIGARCCNTAPVVRRWMGVALLPQAGAAMGMALVAANQFPQHKQILLTIVISTTIFFEIIGPVLTKMAINKAEQEA